MEPTSAAWLVLFLFFLVGIGIVAVRQSSAAESTRVPAVPDRPSSDLAVVEGQDDSRSDITWAPEIIGEAVGIVATEGRAAFDAFAAPLARTRREAFDFRVAVFEGTITIAIHDAQLDEGGLQRLRSARDVLGLPTEVAKQLLKEVAQPILVALANEAMADRRVTLDEALEIQEVAERVGLPFDVLDLPLGLQFAKLFAYAQWETGKLPEERSPFVIEAMEKCHWAVPAELVERVGFGTARGLTLVPPITQGAQYRAGGIAPSIRDQAELQPLDSGTLVMTSKRVVFWGNDRTESQNWVNVKSITPFADGITIDRRLGHPFTVLTPEAEGAAVMASVLVRKRDLRWGRSYQ